MRKFTLLAIFSVITTFVYGQCPDPPSYDKEQFFCSAAVWALIGEDSDKLGDLQIFPDVHGWSITWYEDDGTGVPGAVIANPNNEVLVSGTTYYVTQTDLNNCESDALAITVSERDCACIKDPNFEDQNGNPRARGYDFFEQLITTTSNSPHKTCASTLTGATLLTMGPLNNTTNPAVFVSSGNDHLYSSISRTNPNPFFPYSEYGIRLNNHLHWNTTGNNESRVATMQKEFIAGEVFVFYFALALNDANHMFEQQPYFQVRIYDQNNNLVITRCVVTSDNSPECILFDSGVMLGSAPSPVLFSDWSCIKLNTLELQGQPVRVEFTIADCVLLGHFGYVYIDDIYVGDDSEDICGDSSFGYVLINSVTPSGTNCFIPAPALEIEGCVSGIPANIPGFPLEVCGIYNVPVSQGPPPVLDGITLNIIQNDVVVGTLNSPSINTGANSFCFTVNESDINVLPYGYFTFDVEIDFTLNCGVAYSFLINDHSSFNLCPTTGCANPLRVCDQNGTGIATFDLTAAEADIHANWDPGDLTLTYYYDENDAHSEVNPITNPANYTNTQPGGQTIYVRIDWNLLGLVDSCYYLVELQLFVDAVPELTWDPVILICDNDFDVVLVATPENLSELGIINFTWYRDNVQLPIGSNIYTATVPGEYTVVISNFNCSTTQTVTIKQVDFKVDLGSDASICVSDGTITLTPTVTPEPGTTFNINDATYLWSTGETTPSITITTAGLYWVEVTYGGCTEIDDVIMDIVEEPVVSLGPDILKCKDETLVLEAVVTNMDASLLDFTWYDGGSTPIGTGSTLQLTDIFGGEADYTVIVYDPLTPDCYGEDTINVKYFSNENCIITQGLSPDGSPGFNDNLDLEFLAQRTGIASLQIFNRHGAIVYELANYSNEWTGQSKNGDLLPTGLYYYVVNLAGNDPVFGNQTNGYIYINRAAN